MENGGSTAITYSVLTELTVTTWKDREPRRAGNTAGWAEKWERMPGPSEPGL